MGLSNSADSYTAPCRRWCCQKGVSRLFYFQSNSWLHHLKFTGSFCAKQQSLRISPLHKFALAFLGGIWYTLICKRKDGESSVAIGMAAERNPTAERVLPLRAREVHSGAVPLKVTVGGNGCGFVTGRQSVCFCAKIRGGTAEPKLRPMEGRGFFILLKGC